MVQTKETEYPFNKQWNKIYYFNCYPLMHFVDNLYKYRQMEEMWREKFKQEHDYDGVKLCNHNIRYLDAKIAYEEEAYAKKKLQFKKNKTSNNKSKTKFKNN